MQGRRVTRALRALYGRQRTARIGPDLSHRRTLVTGILRTRAVRAAVAQERREKKITRRRAMLQAQEYAQEIAANYSPTFVRFLEHIMTRALESPLRRRRSSRTWRRWSARPRPTRSSTCRAIAATWTICCSPTSIFRHGYRGAAHRRGHQSQPADRRALLRKGGAFFIRRSLRGNALYTVVFMNYLAAIMARGHSLEYFIEGGRSRTGRLLQPKTGMLAMTVRSFLRDPVRPVMFLPVYFGYERIFEGSTYIGELSGLPKEKESIFGLLRALPRLKERFGRVHVNLGEPIELGSSSMASSRGWRTHAR